MATASSTRPGSIRDMLLDAAGLSPARLPMLGTVFDHLSDHLVEGLQKFTTAEPFVSLGEVESGRIGDVLGAFEANAIIGVFSVPALNSEAVIGFDRDLVFTLVEMLFGGDGVERPIEDQRSFSNIEVHVAGAILAEAGKAISAAFALITDVEFVLQRTETRVDFAMIGRPAENAVVARFLLQALNRGGEMFVVIPQSALAPMRHVLSRKVSAGIAASDPGWARNIRKEVQRTVVSVRAVLEERGFTLADMADLRVGQVLALQSSPRSLVKVESNHQPIFWGHLGQADGHYTLRIEDVVNREQEFIDDVLSG